MIEGEVLDDEVAVWRRSGWGTCEEPACGFPAAFAIEERLEGELTENQTGFVGDPRLSHYCRSHVINQMQKRVNRL